MEKLLSIIVPVYNKELFLDACIESINKLEINKAKIEAIFVDDCSRDNSLKIIEAYVNKYDFIKMIKLEENTGSPSEPRNMGIREAKGQYITFLDADDWLDPIGLPMLLDQAIENNSDVAFGQSIKHTDNTISKLGRFTSYKVANNLIPYEINKIFRAVGPPGKMIKRDIIVNNNIEFKQLKFGEDKLFFINAIAKCKSASMNSTPIYHVNRYTENQSLVGETSIIEKTNYNLIVLKEVLKLDLPERAEFQAISRIVEVDFISRLFNGHRFLKNNNKEDFYHLFDDMVDTLKQHNKNVEDYIVEDKYKNIYQLLITKDYEKLFEYISMLLKGGKGDRYVKDNQVHFAMPDSLKECIPMKEDIFAVYEGTQVINDQLTEVIRVYKDDNVKIDKVRLTEIYNEPNEIEVDFYEHTNYIYINTDELNKCDYNFNINLIHDEYKPYKVNMNLPNGNNHLNLKRQNFKAEFIMKEQKTEKKVEIKQYFMYNPVTVSVRKKIYLYKDVEFTERIEQNVEIGEIFEISEIRFTKKGTPRLITIEGYVITANREFVTRVNKSKSNQYIFQKPHSVIAIKNCKVYEDRNFKSDSVNELKAKQKVDIQKIVLSSKGTPRLKTINGTYITANRNIVKEV
ncbi:glycosyltransferase family 2 protein [Staphylococcus succinus]|uniref:glycosyltransferase family 2 protein n=1 Tax=Staphylococcus succinus TaxID=61015 RepID=UPI000D1E4E3A|nr:glycosyltransferase family 2 protein [Staphylococcus succinus]MBU0437329.1 glycosyltransferase family 2 protein [Staphylococcus succinus]MEB7461773.1 glycosyltransferase family 2 protein [Staphylococcus succinus]PTI44552.1 glycosyltransferase family 2 protein [Staphylococcus succinus]